jgi:hypothetical protein
MHYAASFTPAASPRAHVLRQPVVGEGVGEGRESTMRHLQAIIRMQMRCKIKTKCHNIKKDGAAAFDARCILIDAPGSDAEWACENVCERGANLSKKEFPRLLPCHKKRLKTRGKQN